MEARFSDQEVRFWSGDALAGVYRLDDPFKQFLHPLVTPRGATVSLSVPHDHRHHKGLMYALRADTVNFWEEVETEGSAVGIQVHNGFDNVTAEGETVGFTAAITWKSQADDTILFKELRTVTCTNVDTQSGFRWTWETHLEAIQDVHLIQSEWSHKRPDGNLINYHGLGIRLCRSFGATGGHQIRIDGRSVPVEDALGTKPQDITFVGSLDGAWPPDRAGIAIEQDQNNTLFIMESPFAYISFGPTNHAPLDLVPGDVIHEGYAITVFDVGLETDHR